MQAWLERHESEGTAVEAQEPAVNPNDYPGRSEPFDLYKRLAGPVQQLLQRWHALQADVRRARRAGEPQRIQHYVLGGAKLARLGVFDKVGVLRHMTRTLLHTARDPGLPRSWCRACMEHACGCAERIAGPTRASGCSGSSGH